VRVERVSGPVLEALEAPGRAGEPWRQPGITESAPARDFLAVLRSPQTLVVVTAEGYRLPPRGRPPPQGIARIAYPGPCSLVGPPLPPELADYHRSLGLGPRRIFSPAESAEGRFVERLLGDRELCRQIRTRSGLRRIFVSYKDELAARLVDGLGLEPVYCAPAPASYRAANDKLAFARAGAAHGFETIALEPAPDLAALEAAFRRGSERWGAGCIVRLRWGAGGDHTRRAPSLEAARSAWQRLRRLGEVVVAPYVPRRLVARNVAAHGLVSAKGFAPLLYSDQRIRRFCFVGGNAARGWSAAEIAPVARALAGVARWMRGLGYVDAPAGVDGFLIRERGELRFLALDPNARLTASMLPWALASVLSEHAAQRFAWEFGRFAVGAPFKLAELRALLGSDLLDAAAPQRGGVLPLFAPARPSATAGWRLPALLLGRDELHVAGLRARMHELREGTH
jgi:hypothetical protein